jgi:hypothetical protein
MEEEFVAGWLGLGGDGEEGEGQGERLKEGGKGEMERMKERVLLKAFDKLVPQVPKLLLTQDRSLGVLQSAFL